MRTERNPPHAVTDAERAAVDRALAALRAEPRRTDLLPLLHDIHASLGWLPRGALQRLADGMHLPFPDVWGVATFYAQFRLNPPRGTVVHVCDDVPCRLRGADALLHALEQRCGPAHRFAGAAHGAAPCGHHTTGEAHETSEGEHAPAIDWETVPCLGQCDHAPAAVVAGRLQRQATVEGILAAVKESAGA